MDQGALNKRFQNLNREIQEKENQLQETNERLQETSNQLQETNNQLRLIQNLSKEGRYKEIDQIMTDEGYRKKLMMEYGLL